MREIDIYKPSEEGRLKIGLFLLEKRQALGLSQDEASRMLRWSAGFVRQMEKGLVSDLTPNTLSRFADAYGFPVETLIELATQNARVALDPNPEFTRLRCLRRPPNVHGDAPELCVAGQIFAVRPVRGKCDWYECFPDGKQANVLSESFIISDATLFRGYFGDPDEESAP